MRASKRKSLIVSTIDEAVYHHGTIEEVAQKLGVSRVAVWSWHSGMYEPRAKNLIKLLELAKNPPEKKEKKAQPKEPDMEIRDDEELEDDVDDETFDVGVRRRRRRAV